MTSSESEPRTTRKRSRATAKRPSDEDEAKKQRGRPRVDPQDETAADKRRTQIRLAQRAYRQRKETTIASLKQQVADLQSTIEEMSKSFLNFNDAAVNLGILQLNPEISQALKSATEQFIALAKGASGEDEGNEDDVDATPKSTEPEILSSREAALPPRAKPGQSEEPASKKQRTVDIGMGYTKTYYDSSSASDAAQNLDTNYAYIPNVSTGQDLSSENQASDNPNGDVNLIQLQAFIPSAPTSPFDITFGSALKTLTMPSPYSFSFNETTFARRLHRATLECGYHLINNMDVRPTLFNHVFKLSLLYNTPEQLKLKFESIMRRGSDASLEFWQTPFIHLGGAGTHYPRRDETGALIMPKNGWNVRSIGPMKDTLGRSRFESREGAGDAGVDIDLQGFEGEWFDAHDVAGYLEEKGLFITERATFAEAEYVEIEGFDDTGYLVSMPQDEGRTLVAGQSNPMGSLMALASGDPTKGMQPDLLFEQPAIAGSLGIQSPSFSPLAAEPEFDPQTGFLGSGVDMDFDITGEESTFGPLVAANSRESRIASAWYDSNLYDESSGSNSASSPSTGTPSPVTIAMHRPPRVADLAFAGTGRDRKVRRKKVVIDVAKLIDKLIMRSVCLGRAPGYRRKDVDRAFKSAIVQEF